MRVLEAISRPVLLPVLASTRRPTRTGSSVDSARIDRPSCVPAEDAEDHLLCRVESGRRGLPSSDTAWGCVVSMQAINSSFNWSRPPWTATSCCYAATSAGRSMRSGALALFLIWNMATAEGLPNSPNRLAALTNADSRWPCNASLMPWSLPRDSSANGERSVPAG